MLMRLFPAKGSGIPFLPKARPFQAPGRHSHGRTSGNGESGANSVITVVDIIVVARAIVIHIGGGGRRRAGRTQPPPNYNTVPG